MSRYYSGPESVGHIRTGSKSSIAEKLHALQSLSHLPNEGKWIADVIKEDKDFMSYLMDLADPSSVTPLNPEALDLWKQSIHVLSDVISQFRRSVLAKDVSEKIWATLRKRFPRIVDNIWLKRKELKVLEPQNEDTRNCITRVVKVLTDGKEAYKDVPLEGALRKYHVWELDLAFWSLNTGRDQLITATEFFEISRNCSTPGAGSAAERYTADSPKAERVQTCHLLITQTNYDRVQAQYALHVLTEMSAASMPGVSKAGYILDGSTLMQDVMAALWRQLKGASDLHSQALSVAGLEFFESWNKNSLLRKREKPVAELEPLLAKGLVPMIARMMYELSGPRGNSSQPVSGTNFDKCIDLLSPMIQTITDVCKAKRTLATQYVKPVWLHDLDALKDLDISISTRKDQMLGLWEKLGRDVGLDEKALRDKAVEEAKARSKGLIGCSWYRCVLYKQQPHIKRIMMEDSNRCGLVQYCSALCQERDWNEGGHREACVPAK